MTTFAQRLWRDDVRTGKYPAELALETFCQSVKDEDLSKQIDSMPDDMLTALNQFTSPDKTPALTQLQLHAFDFNFDRALKWKRHRLDTIHKVVQQRLSKQRPDEK